MTLAYENDDNNEIHSEGNLPFLTIRTEPRRLLRDVPAADLSANLVNFRRTLKKLSDPSCLGEALRRVILLNFMKFVVQELFSKRLIHIRRHPRSDPNSGSVSKAGKFSTNSVKISLTHP